jgi:predicted acyltransferase
LYCLYPAYKLGAFDWFWLAHHLDIGGTGTHAGIMLAGTLLATTLVTRETGSHGARSRFTLLLVAGGAVGALLLNALYGVSKNNATPSFCLWTTSITAALWLGLYSFADVWASERTKRIVGPLALAGGNVLLAYLLSEMWHPFLDVVQLRRFYDQFAELNLACALIRAASCSIAVVALTTLINRLGLRLKL